MTEINLGLAYSTSGDESEATIQIDEKEFVIVDGENDVIFRAPIEQMKSLILSL